MLTLEMKNLSIEINSEALIDNAIEMEKVGENIEEIFNNINDIMRKLHNSDVWKGETNDAFFDKYLELYEYFPKINSGIKKCAKFIKITSNNYTNAEVIINNDVDENIVSLDVNS